MQKIKVYMNTGYNSESVQLSQYDVGVPFQVELYEGSTPYTVPEGALVGIEGTNADGTVFSYIDTPAVIVDVADNLITFKSTRGMTDPPGTPLPRSPLSRTRCGTPRRISRSRSSRRP